MKEAFIDKLKNAEAWIKDGWKEFKDWVSPKWDRFTDWLGDFWEGVKDFFSQEWVQTLLKVIGAIVVVVGVILLGVWVLAAAGIAIAFGTILAAIGFGIAGVVFTFFSGETSFWGMVAGGLASALAFFSGLGVWRLLGAFRLIPASGLLRWVVLGGLSGAGAVGFTLLHGALHYLFTGDSSLWKQAFTFESLFFNFTLGAVMGPIAARIFGNLGVKQIISKQGNVLATLLSRITKRPVSQVSNFLNRTWKVVKGSTIYSAITAGVTAVLDTLIQWKENGKVDWKSTAKRTGIVFVTTLFVALSTAAIPKFTTMGCACEDGIASNVSKQGNEWNGSSAKIEQGQNKPNENYFLESIDYSIIRAYRGIDVQKIPIEYRADPRLTAEMNFKGKGSKGVNSDGWERNARKHFKEILKQNPEFWSVENTKRIKRNVAPIVDETFIQKFPQYKNYIGDKLIHHHIGGGGQVTAVPASLHEGFGGIHNHEKINNVRGNDPLTDIGQTIIDEIPEVN
ncbi:hypothetical protein BGM26_20835 [Bacillus sp. FJAT-29790]|nr:hypothetical protein [Bacillus sp. FJAT-29790]